MLKTYELIGTLWGAEGEEYQYHCYIVAENIDEATETAEKMRFGGFHTVRPYQEK